MLNNIGFILTGTTLGFNIVACLISLILLILLIHHGCYNRVQQKDKILMIICITIYIFILILTAIMISFNIQTIIGDLYQYNSSLSSPCIVIAYLFAVCFGALFWTFVTQAFFCLCCIVYSTYRYLQYSWLYMMLLSAQLLLICILLCPVLFWHEIIYLESEHYCYVPFTSTRGMLWFIFNDYGIPLLSLSLIYLRITMFLRRQSNNLTIVVRNRQQRDLLVIRRILFIVGILMGLGIPTIVLLLMFYITGEKHILFDRIAWFSVGLSMMTLSVSLVMLTPQIKSLVVKKFQRNRIVAASASLPGSIAKRNNTTIL